MDTQKYRYMYMYNVYIQCIYTMCIYMYMYMLYEGPQSKTQTSKKGGGEAIHNIDVHVLDI